VAPRAAAQDDPVYREEARIRLEGFLNRDRAARIEALRRRPTAGSAVPETARPVSP